MVNVLIVYTLVLLVLLPIIVILVVTISKKEMDPLDVNVLMDGGMMVLNADPV